MVDQEYGPPEKPGEPQVRLRIKHGKSARGGWALQETTVELVCPLNEAAAAISRLMEGYLSEVYRIGRLEAQRRNHEEM